MRILLVEDNDVIGEGVKYALETAGALPELVKSLSEAKEYLSRYCYDIVVLDLNLPDGNGLSLIPQIQHQEPTPAILILTAQDSVSDRVAGLDAGADDYLVKPFDFGELLARIRVLERRAHGRSKNADLIFAGICLRPASFETNIGGTPAKLSRREFGGLKLLLENAETVVTKNDILNKLYHADDPPLENAVEVLISRLRKRIIHSDAELKTIRGVGYMLIEKSH